MAKELTSEKLLEILKEDPLIRRALMSEEEKEQKLLKRKETAERLGSLKRERDKKLPELQAAANRAKAEMEAKKEIFNNAQIQWGEAERKLFGSRWGYEQKINECKSFLKQTAGDHLTRRIQEHRREIDAIQNKSHSKGENLEELQKRIEHLKGQIALTEEEIYSGQEVINNG